MQGVRENLCEIMWIMAKIWKYQNAVLRYEKMHVVSDQLSDRS